MSENDLSKISKFVDSRFDVLQTHAKEAGDSMQGPHRVCYDDEADGNDRSFWKVKVPLLDGEPQVQLKVSDDCCVYEIVDLENKVTEEREFEDLNEDDRVVCWIEDAGCWWRRESRTVGFSLNVVKIYYMSSGSSKISEMESFGFSELKADKTDKPKRKRQSKPEAKHKKKRRRHTEPSDSDSDSDQ